MHAAAFQEFKAIGLDKQSGLETELVIQASSLANAKAQAEVKGMIVTDVLAWNEVGQRSSVSAASNAKPGKVTAIGGMEIGCGVCNILAGIFFGFLLLPLLLIPLGIVEIISGSRLLKAQSPQKMSGIKAIAILEIIGIVTCAG